LSGTGILIAGASNNTIQGNAISGNVPDGPVDFSGGVVVLTLDPATPASNNTVRANLFRNNQPDIFWDGAGTGNVFRNNICRTSVPPGLC
jgi:hypothetical protein